MLNFGLKAVFWPFLSGQSKNNGMSLCLDSLDILVGHIEILLQLNTIINDRANRDSSW